MVSAHDRTTPPTDARPRPGWLELAVGGLTYATALALGIWWIDSIPVERSELRGYISYFVSGATGVLAFAAAVGVRIRALAPFGIRRISWRWVLVSLVAAAGVYWVNQFIALGYIAVFGNDTPQGDYQAAAGAGALSLAVTLVLGGGLTGLGEELLFRGVVANTLLKHGVWTGVVLSALIFALVHGLNMILPLAFVVGLVNATLLRRSGSVWPAVIVHVVYNSVSNIGFMFAS
ncbi:CPBP family intramembrane glutamic endopeptidase [Saccharothrix coeruleofusca]|uniref:Abortive infection protein n=1 Tax=Saccharothrix coeruleofusca TaxID=33919 RepID=A0A918EFZ3_9PSEU|nr:CPBP family intramembrane glutamic endopeptidase [Saccharothrix coeruleofusca]MBP2339014.1 membrane protease YdiL (CAAX protease family) [Saccharothrix coeruleofusca]GGP69490.1 putative abortive infection protein [Saccharothrix coeruleofusca]